MTETLLYAIGTASPIMSVSAIVWARMRFNADRLALNYRIKVQERTIIQLRDSRNYHHEQSTRHADKLADLIAEKDASRRKLSEAGRKGALIGNRSPKRKGAKGNV